MHEDDKADAVVRIGQECDGFTIVIDDKRWRIDHEDTAEELTEMFKFLGFTNVSFEDWY